MDQRTSDRNAGATTEFERDVVELLLATMSQVAKEEREDVGTESVLSALVSGDSAAGSAIAPGMKAAGSLGGSIGCRGTSVWVSDDAGDGAAEAPDDEREIDAFWREVRQEQAKRLRWKNRKKKEEEQQGIELPPMTGALRSCLRKALETAREEGTLAVRVRHVAHALVELPDSRAREAMVVEKLDVSAASAALDALRGSDSTPEPGSVVMLRQSGTFGKSGNPLTRKFTAWILGGGAGFGSSVVSAVRAEALRGAVRRGAPEQEPVDALLGILALDRSLTVAGRELPEKLREANQGAELLRRHGARQDAVTRVLVPATGVAEGEPPEVRGTADFEQRLLHVTQLTASAQNSPTVGTTHLLAALLDKTGTDAESAAEIERVLTESGVDVAGLRAEPELRVPGGAARAA
ncbi:Clp protease N-terminal domain-containing protein [Streptomyces turgidiscabies]|uniref:ATP-dependent Clp protease ATP-binding subunit ClpA n=1 Tax=Streptomyces turgidiscabies TaxID=85558 RepID=A0ABU0RP41_9ACTN|nr:Clp protease N-terminal domain-containing protein [Streptomyces turgidiscabies]MDQ0933760.1 ATP-dependent Clp protease ATP-binding subunit ClpA [Streptomyces turgidiscabies]